MDINELIQKIAQYGQRTKIVDGKEYEDTAFLGFRRMQKMTDLKILDKGCETWIEGEKYPMRVFTDIVHNRNLQVTKTKRLIPVILKTLKSPFAFIYLWFNWKDYVDYMWFTLQDVFMDCDRYSQPVREIYRVLSGWSILIDKIRDIVCAILEFDIAYRYRLQDIVSLLNKKEFAKNPLREIRRLIYILREREISGDNGMGKFMIVIPFLWILRFKFIKLKEIIKDINLDEIKLSKEDIYWTNSGYEEYNFRGLSTEIRKKEYEKEKNS